MVKLCQSPTIDFWSLCNIYRFGDIDFVQARIKREKCIGVPECIDEGACYFSNDIDGDTFLNFRRKTGQKIPSQRVCTNVIEHVVGVDDVAQRLGHFLAVFVDNMTQADTVAVGHTVGDQRCNGVQAVEPAACLVNRFADVFGWEMPAKRLLVLEWIVPLGIRHRP